MVIEAELHLEPGVSTYNFGTLLEDRVARVIEPALDYDVKNISNLKISSVIEEI